VRFQDEAEGLAEGAGLSLQRVAEWLAVEDCASDGCSGFVCLIDGLCWIGRNNDLRAPEVWGFVTVKHVENRIPTMTLGMEGDVFTATGINRERLWLHSQYLPTTDRPRADKEHFPGYVVLTEALETCSGIEDVSSLLSTTDRDDGMLLFAVDGKSDESVIFECSCVEHRMRVPEDGRLVATNHCRTTEPWMISESSASRFRRLTELVHRLGETDIHKPDELVAILADDRVEQRGEDATTVYAVVACPAEEQLWCTLGGCPGASCGHWTRIDWPW
jgi:hypothetical protein